jgi:S1-C subfamily serine protease
LNVSSSSTNSDSDADISTGSDLGAYRFLRSASIGSHDTDHDRNYICKNNNLIKGAQSVEATPKALERRRPRCMSARSHNGGQEAFLAFT